MQLDKIFSTQFLDATTWLPLDWLTGVTISILEINETDGTTLSIPVNAQACINWGNGFYRYFYSWMWDKLYEYFINPNNSNTVISSGWVDKRLNRLDSNVSDIRAGGYAVSMSKNSQYDYNASDRSKLEKILESVEKKIPLQLNETNSHIELVKTDLVSTIESIEIPEIKETDLSDVVLGIGVLKSRFTKLSEWLKTEQKKEMDSKDKENEGKMSELQEKIDEMEEAFEEMQGLSKSEVEEKQKLIDEMEETAKEIMQELEK